MAMQLSAPATVASLAAMIRRCKRLTVFSTSTGPAGETAFVRESRLSPLRRTLLSNASTLVAQTDQGAVELREVLPHADIRVIPTPVRLPIAVPGLRGNHEAVYIGRIVRGKNLEVLAELWPHVAAKVPGAHLTLVGAGVPGDPVEADLARMRSSDPRLNGNTTMTGWVSDVTPFLEDADVFVFPSDSEGMSNALLEACAWGRVVVASDIPSNRTILGDDYPLLVDPDRREQFENALLAALCDGAVRRQARNTIVRRIAHFSVDTVLDRIEASLTE
jgi:glycosyltransferase involved in cell wall biosynthesis